MTIYLKPCPFCGTALEPMDTDEQYNIIGCKACKCDGPWIKEGTPEQAAMLWNTRAKEKSE